MYTAPTAQVIYYVCMAWSPFFFPLTTWRAYLQASSLRVSANELQVYLVDFAGAYTVQMMAA